MPSTSKGSANDLSDHIPGMDAHVECLGLQAGKSDPAIAALLGPGYELPMVTHAAGFDHYSGEDFRGAAHEAGCALQC